jgi:guanylate kinase
MSENSELGLILVISGPSGVGKDTVWQAASRCLPTFSKAITCTTRERRPHEVEGVDYFFVSDAEFDRMIREDELIEWAYVHNLGHRYGVPESSVFKRINDGDDVVCVIDVQGALRIRRLFPQAMLVFIKPPQGRESETLEARIQGRSAVDATELATRLETANWELTQVQLYDYQIENDDVERAANELCEVIEREKARREEV